MNRILTVGEILWDILPDKTILGGAPFNFAYRINSLGDNALFVSSLGADELGETALQKVNSLGVDSSFLQLNREYPTGTVDVSFDANHLPDYVINPDVAYDHIQLTEGLLKKAREVECLCFGTLIQRAPQSRQTVRALIDAANNAVKFLDINLRKNCFTKETVTYSLKKANILKLNDDEVRQIGDMLAMSYNSYPGFCERIIRDFGLDYVLVTFGEYGALAQSAFGEEVYVPGYKINLADSLGSGDAFSAAFVYHILSGHSLKTACEYGNALGALTAATHGATTPISHDGIYNLLRSNSNRIAHPQFS